MKTHHANIQKRQFCKLGRFVTAFSLQEITGNEIEFLENISKKLSKISNKISKFPQPLQNNNVVDSLRFLIRFVTVPAIVFAS